MFRAIVLKELREVRGIAIGAILAYGAVLFWYLANHSMDSRTIPFAEDYSLGNTLSFFAILMVVLLGFRQTFGESVRGTYPFLLHRSASIRLIITAKLFAGLSVYLVATAVPIGIYCIWAATPGNHASPFEWSMTVPAWVVWFVMTLIYLGAFLSGIMPGRWYGSRFLPLAAAGLISCLIAQLNYHLAVPWWLCGSILVADVWMIILILFVAKARDYS